MVNLSKAAERKANVIILPSLVDRISLWILRAVSVEQNYPICRLILIGVFELFMCAVRWLATAFSRTFDRKLRIDMDG